MSMNGAHTQLGGFAGAQQVAGWNSLVLKARGQHSRMTERRTEHLQWNQTEHLQWNQPTNGSHGIANTVSKPVAEESDDDTPVAPWLEEPSELPDHGRSDLMHAAQVDLHLNQQIVENHAAAQPPRQTLDAYSSTMDNQGTRMGQEAGINIAGTNNGGVNNMNGGSLESQAHQNHTAQRYKHGLLEI